MFCEAGPAANPYVPAGPDQPRLFTYIWPAEQASQLQLNGAGTAAPLIDLVGGGTPAPTPAAKAAMASRRTSAAATPLHPLYQFATDGLATASTVGGAAGGSNGRGGGGRTPWTGRSGGGGGGGGWRDAPMQADWSGWREDRERGWAALQLLQAFTVWRKLVSAGERGAFPRHSVHILARTSASVPERSR